MPVSQKQNDYSIFQVHRKSLLELISRSYSVFEKLDMKGWVDNTFKLKERVASESFKVMVIGEFKRGKSTFINALLGEEVLPAYATPCTAVINEIKWGEQKRALLYFRSPLKEPLPDLAPQALRHIREHDYQNVPPLEIAVEDLEEYVVIADPAKDQAQSVAETPYEKVELYWPLELCQNGVEIIDSPGLNEHGTRTRITTDYLSTADAILFVMSCHALASESEMRLIENNIRGAGHNDIFFICNRFDEIRPRERDRLVAYGRSKLGDKTELGEEGIFFLSALDALEGRLEQDDAMVEGSGIIKLENTLSRFLTNDRGKVKLLQPARELNHGIKEARNQIIPGQKQMLEQSVAELENRYRQVKPRLEDLEHRREQIINKINNYRERLKGEVRRETVYWFKDLSDSLPRWAEELETENEIKFLSTTGTKKQAEILVSEIVEKLKVRIETEQAQWVKTTLEPQLSQITTEMTSELETNLEIFFTNLDQIKTYISGIETKDQEWLRDTSGVERFLAAAGGFLVGGAGSALIGATMGYKEMLKSLIPQIVLAASLVFVVGITNPWILIPALLGGGYVQGLLSQNKHTNKIKKHVGEEMAAKLKEDAYTAADKMAGDIYEQTGAFVTAAQEGLSKEIQAVRDQVESVLRDKKAGEAQVAAKRAQLTELEQEIQELDNQLMDLVLVVAGGNK